MSPNINSFVGDLVEMARAMEELPEVKTKLHKSENTVIEMAETIGNREAHIIVLKQEIEGLQASIRSLEVARDDAELRFLELEDKSHNAIAMAKAAAVSLGQLTGLLDPPKPEPEVVQTQPVDPKPEPVPSEFVGVQDNPTPVAMSGDPTNVDSWASGPGQSEADPIITASLDMANVSEVAALHSDTVQINPEPEPSKGRYSGHRYHDWVTYVPLHQWLAEGGTEEDYNWRPQARSMTTF